MADTAGSSGMLDHQSALEAICRLCETKFNRRGIPKMSIAKLVARATSVCMENDDKNIHPPFICELCDRKLSRWSQKCKQKKSGPEAAGKVNIVIKDFAIHDYDCDICSAFDERTEADLLHLSLCRELGGKSSFLILNRNHKVLLISPDDDGNSELCLSVKDNGDWTLRAYGELVDTQKTHLKVPEKVTVRVASRTCKRSSRIQGMSW